MIMSHLKHKSEENLKSANLLISESLYSPSIHCAYYACVQYMLHILHTKYSMTQTEIEREQKENSIELNAGFHAWLINKFCLLLMANKEAARKNESRIFYNDIINLKSTRIHADYNHLEISKLKSTDSLMTAEKLIKILNTYFNL